MIESREWVINGKVQGVGFRPFVYRLARQLNLVGWVRNNIGQVEIQAQGDDHDLDLFHSGLVQHAPTISEPRILSCRVCETGNFSDFQIHSSETGNNPDIHIPPDYFTCADCLAEMQDPDDRRYQYPFTNCTQCGPRYTLIESLPYDRANTSMHEFPLCDECRKEYENPLDRRFHAEPLACPVCGPQLHYKDPEQNIDDTQQALKACIEALKHGQIVAVKGVGGYHLMCDAANDIAIKHLRERKGRPHKPLAVMFPSRGKDQLDAVREAVDPESDEADLLRSPSRPIVLVGKKGSSKLSYLIAPDLGEIGVMLAYSPLHHLLLNAMGSPLVATSANISGEPVLIDEAAVEERLQHISDHFLHHNRTILRPADDSVYRKIAKKLRPIRLGRGHAPIEIELPFQLKEPMLACGSHMKNTVALAWKNRLVVSPHIGDLNSPRSMEVFEQTIEDLQRLYRVRASSLACDAHPDYGSTRWAERFAKNSSNKNDAEFPLIKIQHHRAHASALVLEHWGTDGSTDQSKNEPWLIFCWDGAGYGDDQSIWGGEAFYGRPGSWRRIASMRPFHLPGGEKAARELWRSATGLCWEEGYACPDIPTDTKLLERAWRQGINSPKTTAVGRLFDAASALSGQVMEASYEGHGPMLLEHASDALYKVESLPIALNGIGVWQADWANLLPELRNKRISKHKIATLFHSHLAHTLLKQVQLIREKHPVSLVGLSGGVFQNKKLSDYVIQQLIEQNITACMSEKLPVNDAGISAGQIVEAAMKNNG